MSNLNEKEQWDIINETGILQKVRMKEDISHEPHFFIAILLSVPLILAHAMFDYVVHLQFRYENDFTLKRMMSVQLPAWPALIALGYVTNKFKHIKIAQIVYMALSGYMGCLVVDLTEGNGTFHAMCRAPGMVVVGILLIIQAELTYAVTSVMLVVLYYYREVFLAYWPSGAMPKLEL